MNILAAIEFTPEIDQVGAMHFLDENNRNASLARFINDDTSPGHALRVTGHAGNGFVAPVFEGFRLDIDHDEGRGAFDQLAFAVLRRAHFLSSRDGEIASGL